MVKNHTSGRKKEERKKKGKIFHKFLEISLLSFMKVNVGQRWEGQGCVPANAEDQSLL